MRRRALFALQRATTMVEHAALPFKGTTRSVTVDAGARLFFVGQGLLYWDEEMASNGRHAAKQNELEDILQVATADASVFLTVRYARTGRTVMSRRLHQSHGWFRYSVLTGYYLKAVNECDRPVVLNFKPFKGLELAQDNAQHYI